MKLGLLEDSTLYHLAKEVVPDGGSGVDNAQISGLLNTIRASGSSTVLRTMTQHQLEKARKGGDREAPRAAFYERLFKALQQVEKHADDYVRATFASEGAKADRKRRDQWSGRLALTLMIHIAGEHRWRAIGK